ncbi:hypothetical protein BDB00DRAFT_905710 [Zychaea mexicana]|uniref:uncharacterized protein n=1 Tax=Zychaea mexicana TaxID=64656 RepID=UPI0022FDEE8C|nr:uncharacterized protein BDB00DRAFT_905710 [Zychaea mexicana]KAI9493933.1 hypothetical protein BDB00DRAFT_905710 [Zychaea mexicana]
MKLPFLALGFVAGNAILSTALPLLSTRDVQNSTSTTTSNKEVVIHSGDDFCLFLPPQPGLEVASHENDGAPFCSISNDVPGASQFPQGGRAFEAHYLFHTDFITTAHYERSEAYEQVTGFFDRTKYNLQESDGGGQYDSHASHKPTGATCAGYPYFVSMIEPSENRFCIRCCQNTEDCPTGRSEYGCLRIIPGDYSQGSNTDTTQQQPTPEQSQMLQQSGSSAAPAASATTPQPPNSDNTTSQQNDGSYILPHEDVAPQSLEQQPLSGWEVPNVERAFDAFPSVVKTLQTELDNGTPIDQIQNHWTNFLNKLAVKFPDSEEYITKMQDITADFDKKEDWEELTRILGNDTSSLDQQGQQQQSESSSAPALPTAHQDQASW